MDKARDATAKKEQKKDDTTSIRDAGQKTMDLAKMLSGRVPDGSRLVVDVPLSGKGQVRLVLSEPTRRTSVWGSDIDEAMKELLEKT